MSCLFKPATVFAPIVTTQSQPCYLPARVDREQKYIAASVTTWHDQDVKISLSKQNIKKAEGILYVPIDKDRQFDVTYHAMITRNDHKKIITK